MHNRTGPRWATLKSATASGPYSRSRLYVLASKHPDLFRKDGRNTIVDLWLLDDLTEALPKAHIKPAASPDLAPEAA